jgi:hypothetical protein
MGATIVTTGSEQEQKPQLRAAMGVMAGAAVEVAIRETEKMEGTTDVRKTEGTTGQPEITTTREACSFEH